jgi:hypothetical protein
MDMTPQDKYNQNIINEIKQDYTRKGAEKVRLIKYYEKKKWGAYVFEHVVTILEKDNFGNPLRQIEKNFYSTVEVRPDQKKIYYESRKDSRRVAEDAYDNIIDRIENMIRKGHL